MSCSKHSREMGKTILISSHILHELGQLCTQIGIIEAGRMVAQGQLNDIYRKLELTRVIHIQVAEPPENLEQQLSAAPGAKSVERQADRFSVRLNEDESSIEDFHDYVHGLGARIRMFQPDAMDHGDRVHETDRRADRVKSFLRKFSLPLVAKELLEQAARPRTYVARTVYAVLLFATCLLVSWGDVSTRTGPLSALGSGVNLFEVVVALQFVGITLFMPARACGAITSEKERDSLGLLFLTKLGPWTILLEKYVANLVTMFTYILLCLPILVVAYSLGGLTPDHLLGGIWLMVLTTLMIGALCLCCSAFFRTTTSAFVVTYLLGATIALAPTVLQESLLFHSGDFVYLTLQDWGYSPPNDVRWRATTYFSPPFQFENISRYSFRRVYLESLPSLLLTFVLLGMARLFLVRRAFLTPRNLGLRFFQALDRFYKKLNNNRLTRGIELVPDRSTLPAEKGVAWRETTKKSLGKLQHLVRVFIALEFTTICVCWFVGSTQMTDSSGPLGVLSCGLWVLAVLAVTVKSASLINSERVASSLDVLLTTPMRGDEIMLQKFAAMKRMIAMFAIPILTVVVFKRWWLVPGEQPHAIYHWVSALAIVIYLPMSAWLAMLVSMHVRGPVRATFASLASVVAWCAIPVALFMVLAVSFRFRISHLAYLFILSPAYTIPLVEFDAGLTFPRTSSAWPIVCANLAFHAACFGRLRQACLRNADQLLGRCQSTRQDPKPQPQNFSLSQPAGDRGPAL